VPMQVSPRDLQSARPTSGNYPFDSENREHLNSTNIRQIMWDRKSNHPPTSSTAKSYLHLMPPKLQITIESLKVAYN
jgi:hypothetical protein